MNREDSMALAIGEALLDLVASAAPELCGVGDVNDDAISSDACVEESVGVQPVDGTLVFDYLLHEQLVLELYLAERRCIVDSTVAEGLVLVTDEHMNVRCFVGAVIDQEDGGRFGIEFDPPFVDRLIGGNSQCPLADRVRVCTYLVRIAGKAVGVLGQPLRVSGDPVGFLRHAVSALRELVRLARLEQCDETGARTERASNCGERGPEHIPIHNPHHTTPDETTPSPAAERSPR